MASSSEDLETPPPPEERLDSWKEIASYLKRDVSTVQRWEKREGMPVHRHMHNRLPSVYAYRSELEAWWNNRHPELEREDGERKLRISRRWVLSISAVAAGAVFLALALRLLGRTEGREIRGGVSLREVLNPEDVLLWGGAPSSDGKYLSYTESKAGNLALLDLDTGEKLLLTAKTSWGESPELAVGSRISPDGKWVAYSWSAQGDFVDLRLVGVDGSNPRVVYREENVQHLDVYGFMPDGRSVLVGLSRDERPFELAIASLAGGAPRTIRSFEGGFPFHVSLSPDGRYAVYDFPARDGRPNRDLFLVATEDGRETALVEHPAEDLWPLWTPDGKAVLFASDRTGDQSLWRIPVTAGAPGGAPEVILKELGRSRPLGVTDEGAYYYVLQSGSSDVSIASLDPSGGGAIASAPALASASFLGSNLSPDWAPDGRYLAFVSHRGPMAWGLGSRALIIRDLESGAERELKPDMTFFIHPRWSPDGRTILLKGSTGEQKWGLHEIGVEDGSLRTVFHRGSFGGFEWSKDGTAVFYERDSELVRREIATGREEVVYRAVAPWTLSGLSLSPDGRWLALVTAVSSADGWTQVLTLMPSSGGATREILRVQKPETIALGAWTSGGDAVLFVRSSEPEEGERELWRAPVALGAPELLGLEVEGLREVRVHPDGRRIAFTSGWPDYSLWVLEHFLSEGS